MKMTSQNGRRIGHSEIAALAKQLWEREGRRAGRDLEYWLRAERQLHSAGGGASEAPVRGTAETVATSAGTSRTIRLPDSGANFKPAR